MSNKKNVVVLVRKSCEEKIVKDLLTLLKDMRCKIITLDNSAFDTVVASDIMKFAKTMAIEDIFETKEEKEEA